MKNYIYNFNWLFLDRITGIFCVLFISILVARYLGPENFGLLSYAIAFTAFFSFLSNLGLNSIVVRNIVNDEKNYEKIVGTAFYLKLYGGIFALILGSILIIILKYDDSISQAIVMLLLLGYIFQSLDVIDFFFNQKYCQSM